MSKLRLVVDFCCKGKDCPQVYRDEADGSYVVRGYKIDAKQHRSLDLPANEDAVRVPEEVIRMLVKSMRAKRR
jgi:hypothetical protein